MPADEAGGALASVDAHVIIAAEGVSHSAAGFGGCHGCGRCDRHGAGNLATKCTAQTPACCTSQETRSITAICVFSTELPSRAATRPYSQQASRLSAVGCQWCLAVGQRCSSAERACR